MEVEANLQWKKSAKEFQTQLKLAHQIHKWIHKRKVIETAQVLINLWARQLDLTKSIFQFTINLLKFLFRSTSID